MKKNGYEKLLRKVLEILEDNPQDIVDEDEGVIYTGGLWELVSPRNVNTEDESLSETLKAELLENPRKISSPTMKSFNVLAGNPAPSAEVSSLSCMVLPSTNPT